MLHFIFLVNLVFVSIKNMITNKIYRSFKYITIVSIIIYILLYITSIEYNVSIWKLKRFHHYSKEFEKLLPNVPFDFLRNKKFKMGHSCRQNLQRNDIVNNNETIENVSGILISNNYWQKLDTKFGILYLYSAYFDSRRKSTLGSTIRIIAMADRVLIDDIKIDCLMWYNETDDPLVSNKTVKITRMNPKVGDWTSEKSRTPENYRPYLLTCYIPQYKHDHVPRAVSIIESEAKKITCNPSNYLKVVHNSKKEQDKKTFAVCVRGLYILEDISLRLMEWIELVKLMGANQIFFYGLHMPAKVEELLNHYATKGLVVLTKASLPGNQPNEPILQNKYLKESYDPECYNEIIHLNDCLYRNIYRYEYIVNLDIDEIVVPREGTWIDLISYFKKDKHFHSIPSANFFNNLSPSGKWTAPTKSENLNRRTEDGRVYMHMLEHIYRSKNVTNTIIKSFMKTDRVELTTSHGASHCLDSETAHCSRKMQLLKSDTALLHHYRKGCKKLSRMSSKDCYRYYQKHLVKDTTIWAFKKKLLSNCFQTIKEMNMSI